MSDEFDLEAALRRALKREQPSAGFTERVLARATERRRFAAARVWMAIAALLVIGVFAGEGVRVYQQRQQEALTQEAMAQKAGRDLAMALKITSAKLHATQRMIRRRNDGV